MKIRTEFVYPPIPDRQFDWSAVDDDTYEPGCPVGSGRTELAAVKDLMQQLEEDYEGRATLNEAFKLWFNQRCKDRGANTNGDGGCMACYADAGEACHNRYDNAPTDPHHGGKVWKE